MLQCRISTTDKSPHQPLPYTITLASLVKGEVLSPEKIRATTGGIASPPSLRTTFLPPLVKGEVLSPKKFGRLPEGLPHQPSPRTNPSKNRTIPFAFRRMSVCVCLVGFASLQSTWAHTLRHPCLACSSRCTEYCHSHNNCKKTIIPQKSPSHLPPLSKGGGLTAKHKLLLCCVLIAYPRPFYHQTFLPSRRRDCYIPSPHTNPRKTAPSHSLFVLRVRQPHFPQNKIRPRFHGGELIKSLIYKY